MWASANFTQCFSPSLPPPQVGGSVVPRAVGCIPFSPENDKMDQPQLIWDLEEPQKAQVWWPTAPCQLLSTSFHSCQAVMPADSWHGREPKITQTAGVRGVPWTVPLGWKSRHLEPCPGHWWLPHNLGCVTSTLGCRVCVLPSPQIMT